jgi:separase
MASLQASADAVRAAVSSTSTCTPATVTLLGELLIPTCVAQNPPITTKSRSKPTAKSVEIAKSKTTKATAVKSRGKKVDKENAQNHEDHLSPKERSILATEVINATLKALSEAIKAPAPIRRKESPKELVKASARQTLRRSISMPQSPLQPRTLNRVSSSPNISARRSRSSSLSSASSSGNRSTAECARIAFACLRALQAAKSVDLPPLQLENGMSVLVGKMIALGLNDLAIKEVRILKRRLDPAETALGTKKSAPNLNAPNASIPTLAELLLFGKDALEGEKLALAITTQQWLLRLMVSFQKNKHAEVALTILHPSHPSSPTSLILLAAKDSKPEKTARQLQVLSEILLSLSPSVSQGEDVLSRNPRLSISPEVAIQLQALALHNRILWWGFADHKGDPVKDLFDPFLRCLSAFARRSQSDPLETYHVSVAAFMDLNDWLGDSKNSKTPGLRKTLGSIYRLLGSLALEANIIDGALIWTKKVQTLLDPTVDSDARQNSVLARLIGLSLRGRTPSDLDEGLLLNLLDALEKPFKGELTEIEDLLTEISSVRRSAISILAQKASDDLTDGLREMCETLVFTCPRLCLRYLGSTPDNQAATKDLLRYEQRRKFIKNMGMHAIDSVLFLIKTFLTGSKLTWELMESNLQTCLLMLEKFEETEQSTPTNRTSTPSYHVKISNLYFSQYLDMRRDSEASKELQQLRILKRSIDCLRGRPQHERKIAQFSTKLERMAEICKNVGRYDELFKTLVTLRDESIRNGVLARVAAAVTTTPIHAAWCQDEDTTALARTLRSLIKVQSKCLNVTSQNMLFEGPWSDEERGSLLEQHLVVLCSQSNKSSSSLAFQTKVFQAALALYERHLYPIQRLRVIARLLSLDANEQQNVSDSISSELDLNEIGSFTVENTKDQGLGNYLLHLQTLTKTLLELQRQQPDVEVLKQCLTVWSSIKDRCADLAALELEIDDMSSLLIHLQLIADYLEMQGFDKIRIATLRLITDLNRLCGTLSGPDALVFNFTQLGAQWLQLGYSGKAGLAFDRAQSYSQENGVLPGTLLHLHLSYSEYLLAIGNFDKW